MRIKPLTTLLLIFFISIGYSQSLKGLKALDIPQKFVLPNGDPILEKEVEHLPGNIWEVFSDRTYNKTTERPGGGDVIKVLQYLERFYVVETKKKYIHIVKDPEINSDGSFSHLSEDFGWIDMEKMLLWRHCIVDESGRNKRVFIFKNEETDSYFEKNVNDHNNATNNFQVLYVFKEGNNSSLLVKQIRLNGYKNEIDTQIIGWVDNEKIYRFSSNIFAEPILINSISLNLNKETPSESHYVFFDKKNVKRAILKNDINLSKVLWSLGSKDEITAHQFRFPIISIQDSIAKVLVYFPHKSFQFGNYSSEIEEINEFYDGYCSMSQTNKKLSYIKALLFNKIELANLLELFDVLLSYKRENSNDSIALARRFRDFFNIHNSVSNSMILGTSFNDLLQKKYGCSSNTFSSRSIKEIFFSNTESKENYYMVLKENFRALNLIYNDITPNRSFLSNGNYYYWILCEYMP